MLVLFLSCPILILLISSQETFELFFPDFSQPFYFAGNLFSSQLH